MRSAGLFFSSLTAVLFLLAPHPRTPLVVWNATASAPLGLYRVQPATRIARGDLVLAMPPDAAAQLAAARGYLPRGTPLIKHVAALARDSICADVQHITINQRTVATRRARDVLWRPLPAWTGCHVLKSTEVFLLNADVPNSFDGRYFGTVPRQNILGRLVPVWLR